MLLCLADIAVVGLSRLELEEVGSEWVVKIAVFEGMFSRRARARVRIGDIAEVRGISNMVRELEGLWDGGGCECMLLVGLERHSETMLNLPIASLSVTQLRRR